MLPRKWSMTVLAIHYFNVHDGTDIVDEIGTEMPDLASVRAEALRYTGELLRDGAALDLWAGKEWRLVVTDEGGNEVLTLRFAADQPEVHR